jgi:hypothetical protein
MVLGPHDDRSAVQRRIVAGGLLLEQRQLKCRLSDTKVQYC